MKIYCMSDIHGCLAQFEKSLSLIADSLDDPETRLCLLGDYIHGGIDNYGVLDKIIQLQEKYGTEKIIALMGNHEEFVLLGESTINHAIKSFDDKSDEDDGRDDKYIRWMEKLPRYYTEGKTIFVHAGIEEDVGDLWEWGTDEKTFVGKYPAETGKIDGLDGIKVVAGHVGTAEISGDPYYHDIYMDESHIYIDGTVLNSGIIPVLLVDIDSDKYYRVTESGKYLILPYEHEN